LTFDKSFNKHQVTALIGHSVITYNTKSTSASKTEFTVDDEYLRYFSAGTGVSSLSGGRDEFALMSYFGRVNYNYAGKYLFQANIRADGSSRFGANNKWGQFPSVGVGWRISEEEFLKNVNWLSNLKIKGSYGVLGTMPSQYYGFMSTLAQVKYVMGESQDLVTGYYPGSVDNKDFKWETSYQTNVGFDLGLFKNKLSLTAEYYEKYTKNILQVLPLPLYSGTSSSLTNIGEMKNKGVEISATLNNNAGDFNYTVSANITTIKNTVVKLFDNDSPISSGYTRTEVGHSIGEFYGYVMDGIFQNAAEVAAGARQSDNTVPGDIRYKNLNGDDRIDGEDMAFLGNPIPTFTYGGNIGLEYKGIDFSLSIYGVAGNDIYYESRNALLNGGYGFNKSGEILNRWQKEGDITNIPRVAAVNSSNNNYRVSDLYLCNGSYLRLSNIQLGYTLKSSVTKKIGISRLRIYASANNLATISDYPGFDPEVTIENALSAGIDWFTYPVPRTILFGLNLTF
jgi:TonB-linked SusC/RagA family outer membrane protein